ncbi:MAG: YggT family protein [Sphaerochaetaceae bacterium]|jgi:YggT family protein|nr:YggT family protein [Sphaerochaetaceae bacterium]
MEFFKAICQLISSLLGIYSLLLGVRIMLTWFPAMRGNSLTEYLRKITDPFLNMFRSIKVLRIGMLDLSPLLGFLLLNLLKSIFTILGYQGTIQLKQILGLIIQGLWSYLGSYAFVIVGVILLVRLLITDNVSPTAAGIKNSVDPKLEPYVRWVYRSFFKGRAVNEKKVVATAFAIEAGLGIILNLIMKALINALLYA